MSVKNSTNVALSEHDKAVLSQIFNSNLPFEDAVDDELTETVDNGDTTGVNQARSLEVEGVQAAESGNVNKAVELLSEAVRIAPARASCYNNRAQAFQLSGNIDGALEDLNKAIELSDRHSKVACQALTQRGIIHKFKGRDSEALKDFKAAAELGGEFAKQQVIAMNPYAALCNQMLSQVIKKVKTGEM